MRSRKMAVVLSILTLVIGFAAVTTTLVLNGDVKIASNSGDFDVYFSKVYENEVENNSLIKDKTHLEFSASLSDLDETYVLDYEVTNGSRNYDAKLSMNCTSGNEYVSVVNDFNTDDVLVARKIRKGKLTITLIKAVVEDTDVTITCSLSGSADERDKLGNEEIKYESTDYLRGVDTWSYSKVASRVDEYGSLENYYNAYYEACPLNYLDKSSECTAFKRRDESLHDEYNKENADFVGLWGNLDQNKVETITLKDTNEVPENALSSWDGSVAQNGSISVYTLDEDGDDLYELYIGQDGGVIANPNSSSLFDNFSYVTDIYGLENLDTSKVFSMNSMFESSMELISLDLSSFDTSKVVDMEWMFDCCEKLKSINLSSFDTSNLINMSSMFRYCESIEHLDLSNFNTSRVKDMNGLFMCMESLLELDLSSFNTSSAIDMSYIFESCEKLKSLNIISLDTSNVSNMAGMFDWCLSLESLDISNFDTSSTIDMSLMFYSCSSLINLNLDNFNTGNVTRMRSMFKKCTSLTSLDLSNFNTSKVTDMFAMFANCSSLTDLNISNFDLSNVTDMTGMFANSPKVFASITVNSNNCTKYQKSGTSDSNGMFEGAATEEGARIVVNFTSLDYLDLVEDMLNTKSENSNIVINGEFPKYSVSITGNDDVIASRQESYATSYIKLSSKSENNFVTSFKLNGNLVEGSDFVMPDEDVVISDIVTSEGIVIESEHYPYPNKISKVYGEKTFEGATSITVNLYYQTYDSYDKVYVYYTPTNSYTYYGKDRFNLKKATINIEGNYVKILFTTDYFDNAYYGFRAEIIPHYE